MADCTEEEQFDTLSETDSSDETQILKVEQQAKCIVEECKESFTRIDKLYDHLVQSHYPVRFQCKECLMYADKYQVILRHKLIQHICNMKNSEHQCFYCLKYSSSKIGDLVDHLMSCIISNNDSDGHKLAKFLKSSANMSNKINEDVESRESAELISQLRVDHKTGQVTFQKKRVSEFRDQHSHISAKRRAIQNSLYNKRLMSVKLYDSYILGLGQQRSSMLAPTGNLFAFLHKANQFNKLSLRKRKLKQQ